MTDRLIHDGQVAVLYSPGFGAGWSTWANSLDVEQSLVAERMIFDPQIADLVDRRADGWQAQVEAVATLKYPNAYLGGLETLQVEWLPVGTQFRIVEHDGDETIETRDSVDWITA